MTRLKHTSEASPESSNAYEVDGLKDTGSGKIKHDKTNEQTVVTESGLLFPDQPNLELSGEIIVDSKGTPTDLQKTERKMGTPKKPVEFWWKK
jgi:hypothetical protein